MSDLKPIQSDAPAAVWQEEVLFFDSQSYFGQMLKQMELARKTIDVEVYIFQRDGLGEQIIAALKRAVQRGVVVRVVVDGIGSIFDIGKYQEDFLKNGVAMRVYHPIPFLQYTFRFWIKLRIFFNALSRINNRTHRKITIIDGETAFVSSMNFVQLRSRETGVMVRGEQVKNISATFERLWTRKKNKQRYFNNDDLVRLNDSKSIRRAVNRDLLRRILSAKERVYLTTAYFIPSLSLIKALCAAARRDVHVVLLLPGRPDLYWVKWIMSIYYELLLINQVRIFEYDRVFLHAKTMLIDNWATVGSSNLNHRSSMHDLEIDVVLTRPESITAMHKQFNDDLYFSREIKIRNVENETWSLKIFRRLLFLFRRWM